MRGEAARSQVSPKEQLWDLRALTEERQTPQRAGPAVRGTSERCACPGCRRLGMLSKRGLLGRWARGGLWKGILNEGPPRRKPFLKTRSEM